MAHLGEIIYPDFLVKLIKINCLKMTFQFNYDECTLAVSWVV